MKPSANKIQSTANNFEKKFLVLLKNHYVEEIKKQVHHTNQIYMNLHLTFDMNLL
jgi:hypothetical protein